MNLFYTTSTSSDDRLTLYALHERLRSLLNNIQNLK